MYRVAAAPILLIALTLSAQDRSRANAGSTAVPEQDLSRAASQAIHLNSLAGACPISMDAKQGVWDHTLQIRNGQKETSDGFGQRISLTLVDNQTERIVAAKVKILGLSGRNRMLNTRAISGSQPDASRIIKMTSFSEVKGGVTAELYVPGFTSVTSIQLLEIIYANGSTWSNSQSTVCRVVPDPLMFVAGH